MRNDNHIEDQKVFRFINSKDCKSYEALLAFLKGNGLPLYERWVFYFWGKIGAFDNEAIEYMGRQNELCYGAHQHSEVFWWTNYMSSEDFVIQGILEEEKLKTVLEARRVYIERGWQFVEDSLEQDYSMVQMRIDNTRSFSIQEKFAHLCSDDRSSLNNFDEDYCSACQMSPCMCSDLDINNQQEQ